MKNYRSDPQLGEQLGEGVWMAGVAIETAIEKWRIRFPDENRAELLDRFHAERVLQRRASKKKTVAEDKPEGSGKANDGSKKRAGTVGSTFGDKVWERATSEPFLLEMVLDTKATLLVYSSILGQSHTNSLLHPLSGFFGAKFWLAVRTLLKASHFCYHELGRSHFSPRLRRWPASG